jgi:hypothetical protein
MTDDLDVQDFAVDFLGRILLKLKIRVVTADKHSWRGLGSNLEDRRSANRTRQVADAESGTCFDFLNIWRQPIFEQSLTRDPLNTDSRARMK